MKPILNSPPSLETLVIFCLLIAACALNPLSAAADSVTLTATSPDGVNTSTLQLGDGLNIRAKVSTSGSQALNWLMTGAGKINTSGYGVDRSGAYYTIGQNMPSSRQVTITATLAANSTVKASYSFTIVNPVPVLSAVAPAQLKSDQSQQIAIAGTHFDPSSVVLFNGVAVPTTYLSYGHLTAQVYVSDSMIGPVSVQVQNPSPGGGHSAIIQQPIELKVVQVGAYNGGTINPTIVRLGQTLQFLDLITNSPGNPACTWSIQGGGWISSNGLYHAPAVMPASSSVTVQAALVTNPVAIGKYTLMLIYPPPTITETSPTHVPSGASTEVSIRGYGFTPAMTLLVKGSPVAFTYHSLDLVTANIVTSSGESGSLSLRTQNPTLGGGGGSSNTFSLLIGSAATASAQIKVQPGRIIPTNFLGFSHEWDGLQWLLGSSETQPNYVYRQLIKNLMNGANYSFMVRIGGDSTDIYKTPQPTIAQAELASAMNIQFTFGLNMGADDPNVAVDQAQAYIAGMPAGSLKAFELGNEPDNYVVDGFRSGTYATTWDTGDYLNDVAAWSCAIHDVAPSVPLIGPSWASTAMLVQLSNFEAQESPSLEPHPPGCASGLYDPAITISQHSYGGQIDDGEALPSNYLLTPAAATAGPAAVAAAVKTTHQNGQLFRIGEINSVDRGGQDGLSNTFQSALWATDVMFEFVNVGVDGVNWHGNENCLYCAFTFTIANVESQNVYTAQTIAPLYYGMLLFQRATSNQSRLLPVTLKASANIKIWATQDSTGTIHVVILNKDESFSGTVSVSLPGYGTAQETQMLAPSYQSMNGVTFGGQTFDGSIDGTIQGNAISLPLDPNSDGTYQVPVEPTSAVLLTIAP